MENTYLLQRYIRKSLLNAYHALVLGGNKIVELAFKEHRHWLLALYLSVLYLGMLIAYALNQENGTGSHLCLLMNRDEYTLKHSASSLDAMRSWEYK
jgi:hypothetical protein